jgi:hypothetical protein
MRVMTADDSAFFDRIRETPVVLWVVGVGLLAFVLRYLYLFTRAGPRPGAADTRAILLDVHRALRQYAEQHVGRLPDSLAALDLPAGHAAAVTYRPIVAEQADEKVLIAHDASPSVEVVEFPYLRPARHVLFWSGRVRLVTESACERLIEADDAFRARLAESASTDSTADQPRRNR